MQRCLALARRGAGAASPNPLVGSVVVAPAGTVLGEGYHARYGGLHAERNAIHDVLTRHPAEALAEATRTLAANPDIGVPYTVAPPGLSNEQLRLPQKKTFGL